MIIIENLCNLRQLIHKEFIFSALPLKIEGADGSPVRACAIIEP
jgi:kynurenine formamidase